MSNPYIDASNGATPAPAHPQTGGEQSNLYLTDLNDVDTTGLGNGKALVYNGTIWVPLDVATQTELDTVQNNAAIVELGYAENVNDFTVASGTSDVPGCTFTFTAGSRPIKLIGHSNGFNSSANGDVELEIWEGAAVHCVAYFKSINASDVGTLHAERRLSLTPGSSHTIRLRATRVSAVGTSHVYGVGNFGPTFLQAVQI